MIFFLVNMLFWLGFAILFYCYAGYAIISGTVVGVKKIFKRNKKDQGADLVLPVTIIVTAYNEENVLEQKIANLLNLDYPSQMIRIIFVTDGSDDRSPQIISKYPELRLLHLAERKGKYAAIKRAVK